MLNELDTKTLGERIAKFQKESRPIISLVRQPRNEGERMGLKITQLLFQGHTRLVTKEGLMPELQDCCDQMVCSIGLDGLYNLSLGHTHVIAIARGQEKSRMTRLALEKRYVNSLIVDNKLAQAILD